MSGVPGTLSFSNCGPASGALTASQLTANNLQPPSEGYCTVTLQVQTDPDIEGTLINTTSPFVDTECSFSGPYPPASGTLKVGIPPTITSPPPGPGFLGIPYVHQVTVTGTSPFVQVNGLPPGLTFDPNTLQITGTPTMAGTFNGSIRAFNGFRPDAFQGFSITISQPKLMITTTSPLPDGVPGAPYSLTFQAIGGTPVYGWMVGPNSTLPPGLTLSSGGVLSGTPTQAGTFTFDVQVTDTKGGIDTRTYTLSVPSSSSTFNVTIKPEPATVGQPVFVTASVTGGVGVATGLVDVWVASSKQKCPAPFEGGNPANPDATAVTKPLDATGVAVFRYDTLAIDDYQVCARYRGGGLYSGASAGPFPLYVIKGIVLAPPKVTLAAPARVLPGETISTQIVVASDVANMIPGGNVRIMRDGVEFATGTLVGGSTRLYLAAPVTGSVTLSAQYGGDGAFPPASSADVKVTVDATAKDGGAFAIPALSDLALAMLALTVAFVGARFVRRRR
jgi:hypothetical protein